MNTGTNALIRVFVSIDNQVSVSGLTVELLAGGSRVDLATTTSGAVTFPTGPGDYTVRIQPPANVDCDALEKPVTAASDQTRDVTFDCHTQLPASVYTVDAAALAQPVPNAAQVGPITAGLKNAQGNPVAKSGVVITATLTTTGAVLSGNTTGTTGANGVASIGPITITGPVGSGPHTIALGSTGLTSASVAGIQLVAGAPTSLTAVGPSSISGEIGTSTTIGVTARDVSSNPVSGVGVQFVASGGPTVAQANVTTNAAGVAQTTVNFASTVGTGSVKARVPSVPTIPEFEFVSSSTGIHCAFMMLFTDLFSFVEGEGGQAQFSANLEGPGALPSCMQVPLVWSVVQPAPGVSIDSDGKATVSTTTPAGDYQIKVVHDDPVAQTLTVFGTIRVLPRPPGKVYFASAGQIFVKNFATSAAPVSLIALTGSVLGLVVDQTTGRIFFGNGAAGTSDIFRMNADGTGLINLTNSPANLNQSPTINPLNGDVLFSRVEGGAQGIFRMKQDGSSRGQLTPPGGPKITPAVSLDGLSYAWGQDVGGGNYEIFSSPITPYLPVRFTTRPGTDAYPFWLSNTTLVWTGDAGGGNFDLFSADAAGGGNLVNLTAASSSEVQPKPGCLPNTLMFLSDRGGASGVYMLKLPENLSTRLFQTAAAVTSATWKCN